MWLDLTVYFVIIAAVLGIGLLSLPVKLVHSGFSPFVTVFAINVAMQLGVVVAFTEILQVARRLLNDGKCVAPAPRSGRGGDAYVALSDAAAQPAVDGAGPSTGFASASAVAPAPALLSVAPSLTPSSSSASAAATGTVIAPDLHTLGKLFLGPIGGVVFSIALFVHFVVVLVSYALAGSQSLGLLIDVNFRVCITPFIVALVAVVLAMSKRLQAVIAALTVAKCVLLLCIIAVVAFTATKVNVGPSSSWSSLMQPFLLGTIALGGALSMCVDARPAAVSARPLHAVCSDVMTVGLAWCIVVVRRALIMPGENMMHGRSMPVLFARTDDSASSIRRYLHRRVFPMHCAMVAVISLVRMAVGCRYRRSVMLGIVTSALVNMMWAYSILRIIPQTIADAAAIDDDDLRGVGVSLEQAERDGKAATVPLIEVLRSRFPQVDARAHAGRQSRVRIVVADARIAMCVVQLAWLSSCITAFVLTSVSIRCGRLTACCSALFDVPTAW